MNGLGGDDTLSGGSLADVLDGGAGNDTLSGGAGDDVLNGGVGNDTLYGGEGNDLLTGGAGDDALDGGYGDDTYVFKLGDGADTITDYDYSTKSKDSLQLGAGLTVGGALVGRSGDDLTLRWSGNSTDQLTFKHFFSRAQYRVEQITFADGTTWGVTELMSRAVQNGTEGADYFIGVADQANIMNGLGGNDTLSGGSLADVLDGGAGNDTLSGAGDDVLNGGVGNDTLYGGEGNDLLTGRCR